MFNRDFISKWGDIYAKPTAVYVKQLWSETELYELDMSEFQFQNKCIEQRSYM